MTVSNYHYMKKRLIERTENFTYLANLQLHEQLQYTSSFLY